MESKLANLLNDFAYNLQEISPRPIENLEIILPYDNWRQLEHELHDIQKYASIDLYQVPNSEITFQTISGIKFKCTCKEINDVLIQRKLQECFKILSK
jgi:hypothetical protein